MQNSCLYKREMPMYSFYFLSFGYQIRDLEMDAEVMDDIVLKKILNVTFALVISLLNRNYLEKNILLNSM